MSFLECSVPLRIVGRVAAAVSLLGIAACLFLAFWVDTAVWMTGLGLIAAGLLWHKVNIRRSNS